MCPQFAGEHAGQGPGCSLSTAVSSVGLLDVRPGAVTKAHGTHGAFGLGLQALHSRKELISLRLKGAVMGGHPYHPGNVAWRSRAQCEDRFQR